MSDSKPGPVPKLGSGSPKPSSPLSPTLISHAFRAGYFPVARSREDDAVYWIESKRRCVIPVAEFHLPKRLARAARNRGLETTVDRDFEGVMAACTRAWDDRVESWLGPGVMDVYRAMWGLRRGHSVEVWRSDRLVGGLFGVALGGAFIGASMFGLERDASKIALVRLVKELQAGGFTLLDAQFMTAHLAQFGAIEVDRGLFKDRLAAAEMSIARFGR